jgi:hypothetical protein
MNLTQHTQQRSQACEREHIRAIGRRDFRAVVNFHKNCVNAARDSGPGKRFIA